VRHSQQGGSVSQGRHSHVVPHIYCSHRAKRYERLLKANGIHPNGGPVDKLATPTVSKGRSKAAIAKAAAAKKRKIEGDSAEALNNDVDDGSPFLSKSEPRDFAQVKQEPTLAVKAISTPQMLPRTPSPLGLPNFALSTSMLHPQAPPAPQYVVADGPSIFDEFCIPELFSQHSFEEMPPSDQPRTLQSHAPLELNAKAGETRGQFWEIGNGTAPRDSILIID